ncbi:MAG: hypothetical protein AAB900_02815 [Patescibacteria group bacterium]
MNSFSTKIKLAGRLVLVLDLVLVVVWLFLAIATQNQINSWHQLEAGSDQADSSETLILKRYLDSTLAERATLGQLLIKGDAITTFIDRLESLAHQSQVQLKITQATAEASGGLSLRLVATGNFAQVYRFLEILDNLPEPLFISRVDLVNSVAEADLPGGTGRNSWRAEIDSVLLSYQN